ncbi:MAG: adenylyltransferase/cytidyltransferase family protein [Burkholderiaceae bacterium]
MPNRPDFERKIVASEHLAQAVQQLARPLVTTNGVFDILHRGHVTYLAQARALGASLMVAINSDASVRKLGKGYDRPINQEADRAALLAALQCVDMVTIFDEPVPLDVLHIARADIYVKGGDYDIETLPEARAVRSWGGRTVAIPFVHKRSTSELLARVRGFSS